MKSTLFTLLTLVCITVGYAQPSNEISAYLHFKEGKLDEAKEAIDKAVVNPKTSKSAKSWKYRGDIYKAICFTQDEKFRMLSENPHFEAYESYKMVLSLDPKDVSGFKKDASMGISFLSNYGLNEGVNHFNSKNYDQALENFKFAAESAEFRGVTDTLAIYNCGLTSERMGKLNDAIIYYEQCAEMGYRSSQMYGFMAHIYQTQGDMENYVATVNRGLEKFPSDPNLLTAKLNLLLSEGKFKECESLLNSLIKQDPNNHVLHFSLGTVLDYLKRPDEAEKSYKEAIKLKADYFDAVYNLGALYFNQGVEINNAASNITDNVEYGKQKKLADAKFFNAKEYLERATKIDGSNRTVLESLKQIYIRTGDTDKYNEVKELLGN